MALPDTWEKLNEEVGYRVSEPIDEYYEPMRISEGRKENRRDLAHDLEDIVSGLLVDAFYAEKYGTVLSFDEINQLSQEKVRAESREDPIVRTREEYIDAVEEYFPVDEDVMGHIDEVLIGALAVQLRHRDDPWYYSQDRARAIAENDSNALWEDEELRDAYESGYRYKTWLTVMDSRVRESHAEVNELTIPIDEPFELQGGYMMSPHDSSLGVSDDECINCRCSLEYS